ncbi:anaerobic glycerol-3-phosphate dehydrogenase subunit B [Peptococcaceae bacterium CEB3]|nr:anaerobic glycerol-3-phosphate dehydrogenase subunit B [Peptococcaceae bacterium CEB3]
MWDGLVIGGGLAGLTAGIRALERGKKILIVSEGVGSLAFAGGVLDFGRVRELRRLEKHPYAYVGEAAQRAFSYFLQHNPAYTGTWGRQGSVLTPLGTLRETEILPRRLDASPLFKANRIVVAVPEGLKDFFPEIVKANLQKQFPSGSVRLKRLSVQEFADWRAAGKSIPGTVYAEFWGTERGKTALKRYIGEIAGEIAGKTAGEADSEAIVFPGLPAIGCPELEEVLGETSLPVVGMTSFPPSAIGLALYDSLTRKVKALGGELLNGVGVDRVEVESTWARRAIIRSKGKETALRAEAFVLATGGFLGRGLIATPAEVKETVFGLPLYVPPVRGGSSFLGEQPYARTGVEVDDRLRPRDPATGEVLLENVFVAGRILAHWDPWLEHCGGGVSLSSGLLAGELL